MGRYRVTTFGLLFPYHEQQALYDMMLARNQNLNILMNAWLDPDDQNATEPYIGDEGRNALGSIPIVKCPSRRAGTLLTKLNVTWEKQGPQGDYYVVFAAHAGVRSLEGKPAGDGDGNGNWEQHVLSADTQDGPFRVAIVTGYENGREMWSDGPNPSRNASWECRDEMAWWADGTTNQLIFGEKHIPQTVLGECQLPGAPTPALDRTSHVDCSWLHIHGHDRWTHLMGASPGRNAAITSNLPIARGPTQYTEGTSCGGNNGCYPYMMGFGSDHPGTCQFLVGDGSVRAFPVTTDPTTLLRLTIVNDGNAVSTP